MIDAAFDALVHQRQHLVLSSDGPLALQHSALRLMHRLQTAPSVRVAAEAPIASTELIEHVNRIVAGLSVRQATDTDGETERLAVLPVRVGADRSADSIILLARLCRALPGSGLRLMLIVEEGALLQACLTALGASAFHWAIGAPAPGMPAVSDAGSAPAAAEPVAAATPDPGPPSPVRPPALPPAAPAAAGLLGRWIDSASRRPLRFALLVAGIPGLLIAGVLAIGSALLPNRASGPSAPSPSAPSPGARAAPAGASPASRNEPIPVPPATGASSAGSPSTTPSAANARPASAPAQTAGPVAAPSKPPSGAASPSAGQTAPAQGSAAPDKPAAPVTPATTPDSATAGAASASAPFECSAARSAPPQVQPRNPSKDAGMVYLTSSRAVTVCVTDGSGALTRADITPDQSRSFFGKAPWQIQASSLRDVQVFFQGSRITLPRNATDRIELIEQRLN